MCQDAFCSSNTEYARKYGELIRWYRTILVRMPPESEECDRVAREVRANWTHLFTPKPTNILVYRVVWPHDILQKFLDYKRFIADSIEKNDEKGCNEKYLYHGTARNHIVDDRRKSIPEVLGPCLGPRCLICSILCTSFKLPSPGYSGCMFGNGIYTSSSSSKADGHFRELHLPNLRYQRHYRNRRAILLNRVVLGRTYTTTRGAPDLRGPPPGYHSVTGLPGSVLLYDESVVYNEKAILPAFVITYDNQPNFGPNSELHCPITSVPYLPVVRLRYKMERAMYDTFSISRAHRREIYPSRQLFRLDPSVLFACDDLFWELRSEIALRIQDLSLAVHVTHPPEGFLGELWMEFDKWCRERCDLWSNIPPDTDMLSLYPNSTGIVAFQLLMLPLAYAVVLDLIVSLVLPMVMKSKQHSAPHPRVCEWWFTSSVTRLLVAWSEE